VTSPMSFEKRVAVVTGAAGGIGRLARQAESRRTLVGGDAKTIAHVERPRPRFLRGRAFSRLMTP
jgi:NAD(P)-dependent dehydrogenase (short-subunit alcohol dehydrogenase family)